MFRFKRALLRNTYIIGLLLRKFCQLNANLRKVKTSNLFVKMLG